MIIGFKPQFITPIFNGTKIHTIREDKYNRWKPGMKIHFATGVRTKNYKQFKEGVCKSVQSIEIKYIIKNGVRLPTPEVIIDDNFYGYCFSYNAKLVFNDGFISILDFVKWFNKDFSGKIIHWTDFKY